MADTVLSYEQLMEMFRETKEIQAESARRAEVDREKNQKEWEQRQKEWEQQQKEWEQQQQKDREESRKRSQEVDRKMEETSRNIDKLTKQMGGLHRSIGELIETLIASHLWEKFADYPYRLSRYYQRILIYDEKNIPLTEIDILLADSEWVMAVEVKREPDKEDIDYHLKRMERIRKYPPAEVVGKKLLGAIAGGAVNPDIHAYAHKAGFFILELLGENVALVPPPVGFSPQIW